MKKKQNTQQSPTDKASPSESASLTSKLQTPKKTKSAEPSLSPESRQSSPRNKKLAEDNVEPSPNTTQLMRTPRNTKVIEPSVAVSPTKCATKTPKRRQQPESAKLSSLTTKTRDTRKKNSQSKSSKGDTGKSGGGQKNVKRKLDTSSTGPCLNVQLRDPNDTLADLQDEEEEENLRTRKAVEEDNSNHVEPDVEEENDNGNDDEPELENCNSSDNEEGEEGKEAKKRKYVPRGPTQMHALKLDSVDPKRTVPFNTNEQPIGDPSVQRASVLGVLVRKLPLTFSKMGTYLREARSRKAGLVLDALDRLQGEEREKRLDKLMPKTMTVREWEDFVKHVNSAEFRVSVSILMNDYIFVLKTLKYVE
ncbi:hypothetical protein MKW98_008016 [Papaver atlanticum]|uniref:Uncharacterized protein n=1 Tax=Papaver atlanticum TaxID=357466 RepID=A0AAD4SWH7_9MAGN|nr:hypothetical protein MKW98_008016 [Papaver atlanticum]